MGAAELVVVRVSVRVVVEHPRAGAISSNDATSTALHVISMLLLGPS